MNKLDKLLKQRGHHKSTTKILLQNDDIFVEVSAGTDCRVGVGKTIKKAKKNARKSLYNYAKRI